MIRPRLLSQIIFFYILSFISQSLTAQTLVINEVTFSEPSLTDEDGDVGNGLDVGNGWIELKNVSSLPVKTDNLVLVLNDTLAWDLPTATVEPEHYLHIWLSGKDRKSNLEHLHSSFSVKNVSNNSFLLYDSVTQQMLDSLTIYSRLDWYESFARYPDGGEKWLHVTTRTPGRENESFGIWKKISSSAPFQPRDAALNPGLFYKDKFWILSGWTGDSANPSNEVWVSDDLRNWKLVNPEGPYEGTANFAVFDGKMWAFDGNAYNSEDGVTWLKVASSLPFTVNNRITEFQDKLWLVSGDSIFSSDNGVDWNLVTNTVPWKERVLPGFVTFNDHLWFFGGAEYHQAVHPAYNDIWKSKDGIEWELVAEHAPWPGTAWFAATVFDNKMWLLSGWDYWLNDDVNDVWFTEDGTNWTKLESSFVWTDRHAPYHWVAHGSMWISSGYNTLRYGLYNDAWMLNPGYLQTQDIFYLKKNMPPDDLNSWSSLIDGSGFPPKGFHYDNQTFVLTSGNTKLETDWEVTGRNSVVRLGSGKDSVSLEIPTGKTLNARIVQDGLSTLILANNKSPIIESANAESSTIINSPDTFQLFSSEIGNLIVLNGDVFLESPTTVKKSITIKNGAIINPSALQLDPGVVLTYSSDEHTINHYNITENTLAKLTLDCNCEVIFQKDTHIDSLILSSGQIELRGSQLFLEYLEQLDSSSYVVIEGESVLMVKVRDGEAFFPIGTDDSYDPITITNSSSAMLGAQVYDAEDCPYSVNVAWKLFSDEIDQDVKVTFQWDSVKQGPLFKKEDAIVSQLVDGVWRGSQVEDQMYLFNSDQNLTTATNLLNETLFTIQTEFGCFENSQSTNVLLFPNPASSDFFIRVKNHEITVENVALIDLNGRIMTQTDVVGFRDYNFKIGNNLSPGIYLVQIKTNSGTFYERLYVQ